MRLLRIVMRRSMYWKERAMVCRTETRVIKQKFMWKELHIYRTEIQEMCSKPYMQKSHVGCVWDIS